MISDRDHSIYFDQDAQKDEVKRYSLVFIRKVVLGNNFVILWTNYNEGTVFILKGRKYDLWDKYYRYSNQSEIMFVQLDNDRNISALRF